MNSKRNKGMETIGLPSKQDCSGCMLCADVCPQKAIHLELDEFGFWQPVLNTDTCTACGVCAIKCPVNKENFEGENPLEIYAAWCIDSEMRKKSSSGGIFGALAKSFFKRNGSVVGVVWGDQFIARHSIVERAEDLDAMHGSKYVQSNSEGIYRKVVDLAQTGKEVLFTGTPCQCAAMKSMMEGKSWAIKVCLCELICNGVASQHLMDAYVRFISKKAGKKPCDINLRDKHNGWWKSMSCIRFPDHALLRFERKRDLFRKFYGSAKANRASCYNCSFSRLPRVADITLGDYWGMSEWPEEAVNGVSSVLVNSVKGRHIWNKVSGLVMAHEIDLEKAVKRNPRVIKGNDQSIYPKREQLLKDLKDGSLVWMGIKYGVIPMRLLPFLLKKHKPAKG